MSLILSLEFKRYKFEHYKNRFTLFLNLTQHQSSQKLYLYYQKIQSKVKQLLVLSFVH